MAAPGPTPAPPRHLFSRLASTAADAAAVAALVALLPPLPVLANLRCGRWYLRAPSPAETAYFMSKDGHRGQWDMSLRRLNLTLLDAVLAAGAALLVDSTGRGKPVPDSFAKASGPAR